MTLFWHRTGPLIKYSDQTLSMASLNPEVKMEWRMSRWELFRFGMKTIAAACSTRA